MSTQESPVRFEFDVGTFNLCDSERLRLQRAGSAAIVLANMDLAMAGLQEVTGEHIAAIETEQPDHIKEFIEPYGHKKSGIMAVVNRDIFDSAEFHRPNSNLSDHQLLVAELTSHDGDEVVIAIEHHPSEFYLEFHRIIKRLRLIKYLEENYPNIPKVIMGDSNSPKAAPLTLVTRAAGFRSAHKDFHGHEPQRTYPLKFGDQLIKSGSDGKFFEVLASRALRKLGNAARALGVIDDDQRGSQYAGMDLERIHVSQEIQVLGAEVFADDQAEESETISDHAALKAKLGIEEAT